MTAACREQGQDPPLFEEIGTHFRVTLSTLRRHTPIYDEREQTILKLLGKSGRAGLSTSAIAQRLAISPRAARLRLASLVERGLIVGIGSGPQDPHRRYYLFADSPSA